MRNTFKLGPGAPHGSAILATFPNDVTRMKSHGGRAIANKSLPEITFGSAVAAFARISKLQTRWLTSPLRSSAPIVPARSTTSFGGKLLSKAKKLSRTSARATGSSEIQKGSVVDVKAQFTQHRYKLGDRVRLSQLGKQRMRKQTTETGTIVGLVSSHNPGSIRVLFDGLKTAKSLDRTYIEALSELAE